jgi:hypothetical protein
METHKRRQSYTLPLTSAKPRPLYTQERDPVPIVQEDEWAPGPVWKDEENLDPTGIPSPNRHARRQSLYQPRY